jgi:hypothetical protein
VAFEGAGQVAAGGVPQSRAPYGWRALPTSAVANPKMRRKAHVSSTPLFARKQKCGSRLARRCCSSNDHSASPRLRALLRVNSGNLVAGAAGVVLLRNATKR